MLSRDKLLAKAARDRFNEQASESLQRHRNDLSASKEIASDAVQDLAKRKTFHRKRADNIHTRKKSA